MCMSYDYTLRMLHHVFNLDILKKYMKNNFVMFCAFPRKHIYIYIYTCFAGAGPRFIPFSTSESPPCQVRYQSQRASKEKTCLAEEAIHMQPGKALALLGGLKTKGMEGMEPLNLRRIYTNTINYNQIIQ